MTDLIDLSAFNHCQTEALLLGTVFPLRRTLNTFQACGYVEDVQQGRNADFIDQWISA